MAVYKDHAFDKTHQILTTQTPVNIYTPEDQRKNNKNNLNIFQIIKSPIKLFYYLLSTLFFDIPDCSIKLG